MKTCVTTNKFNTYPLFIKFLVTRAFIIWQGLPLVSWGQVFSLMGDLAVESHGLKKFFHFS